MSEIADCVFLFDVDNTLLDNDRLQADLSQHLADNYGAEVRDRFWAIFEELRVELGYADYLGALERYRLEAMHHPKVLRIANWQSAALSGGAGGAEGRRDGDFIRRRRRISAPKGAEIRSVAGVWR
jgi:hypothetical protein